MEEEQKSFRLECKPGWRVKISPIYGERWQQTDKWKMIGKPWRKWRVHLQTYFKNCLENKCINRDKSGAENYYQGFIQPSPPHSRGDPSPKPGSTTPPQSNIPNILLKHWKMGEKMGEKSILHWDFCMLILKFSQKFQITWFITQTRKNLPLGFLISFRIINDFQLATNLTFTIIKIRFLN